jgi:hypothetical protein
MVNLPMLIARVTIALGAGALAPLLAMPEGVDMAPSNAAVAECYRYEFTLPEQAQPGQSFAERYFAKAPAELTPSVVAMIPIVEGEEKGEPEAQGEQQTDALPQNPAPRATVPASSVDATLPDAASSTRAAIGEGNTPSYAKERVPVAVYPIKFPYTPRQKFGLFVRDVYDPFNFMAEGFNALWEQSQGTPHAYGGGMAGYGKRLGAIVGTDIVGEFTGTFLFPSILHTDPRYFRMARGSPQRRFFYALSRQLIVKSDSGDDTFNAAKLLSGIATTTISNSYYPDRDRSFPGIVRHTLINMGFDALNDTFREFWPDIAHGLHIPAFVIRRTADPAFLDPMDTAPVSTPQPAMPKSTGPKSPPALPNGNNPPSTNPAAVPENLQAPQ